MEEKKSSQKKKNNTKKTNKKNKRFDVSKINHDGLMPLLKVILVVMVVLILLFVAADRFGNITFSSIGDYFTGIVSGAKSGDGYPYYFESSSPDNVIKINSDLLVVKSDETFVLDSTAKKLSEINHSYSVPVAQTKNGRAVVFDVGGYNYRVVSKTKMLYEKTLDSKIITASLGTDGSVALGLRGEGAMSRLVVYNRSQKVVYDWSCAKESIISTAVSDNGRRAAISIVGAENGELYSKVLVFDFDYAEPIEEYDYKEQIVSNVVFIDGNKLMVSGEKVLSFIKSKDKKEDIDLSLNTLSHIYTDSSKMTVAVFSKYGSSSVKILRGYSKSGKELFSTEINSNVRDVSCEGGYISVLTDRQLLSFNKKGKQVGSAEVSSDGISCFTNGSSTYVLTTGSIDKYKTFGKTEKATTTVVASEDKQ